MRKFKSFIADMISAAADVDPREVEPLLETPPSESMGDIAFPCFHLSKKKKMAPAAIAGELQSRIKATGLIREIRTSGPYLNFFLHPAVLMRDTISEILEKQDDYGASNVGRNKTVVIEYSSPNIAKPFGIGHLRSTVIGESLKRIYRRLGYRVVAVNHLGDWGAQFGKLLYAFKNWGRESEIEKDPIGHLYDLYVRIHLEEEKDPNLADLTRAEFKKLESKEPENLSIWKRFSDLSRKEFEKIYRLLGVAFDSETGESFYADRIEQIEKALEDSALLSKSQDATIVNLDNFDMPAMLIRKSDETTLYATRDLAAAVYRKEKYDFHSMIYVVGVAQTLYFRQLFKVLELMGCGWAAACHHVSFGWVKLGDEMMSTRRGNVVFLEDVIEKTVEKTKNVILENSPYLPDPDKVAFQVGVGAVIFADLAYRRDTDISFDWERMLDFKGSSGPYLQYAHARICSLLRKYGKDRPPEFDTELLRLPEEYSIVKMLARYPEIVERAAAEFEPYIISSFLLELCGVFNTYYQKYRSPEDRILSSNDKITGSRLALADCTRIVLRSGLDLLGLAAPEMM